MPQPIEFVRFALNSISKEWLVFIQSIPGRENLPDWDRMWADLKQEEMRRDLVKSTISGNNNNGMKEVRRRRMQPLHQRGRRSIAEERRTFQR